MTFKARILFVQDNSPEGEMIASLLRADHFEVVAAHNQREAIHHLQSPFDLVLSDLCLEEGNGLDLLKTWRTHHPHVPFLLMAGADSIAAAVEAIRIGADEFLAKPVDAHYLRILIHNLTHGNRDADAITKVNAGFGRRALVGRSPALATVCEQALRAAPLASNALLLGESGTGKELIAQALHLLSGRRAGPFVVVNMAAVPENLIESELFGHVKGAFTDAAGDRVGKFEEASGGTLFIDEVGDFPLGLQAKLLRCLENHTITPVGSNRERRVEVRVIAATNRPLTRWIESGAFRKDLYYRLNVLTILIPPLRERREDIAVLARHFCVHYARANHKPALRLHPDLIAELERLDWSGNVRQLRNCVEHMCVMAQDNTLTAAHLPRDLCDSVAGGPSLSKTATLDDLERDAILNALDQYNGNRTHAADFLGISVRTLQRKLKQWNL